MAGIEIREEPASMSGTTGRIGLQRELRETRQEQNELLLTISLGILSSCIGTAEVTSI